MKANIEKLKELTLAGLDNMKPIIFRIVIIPIVFVLIVIGIMVLIIIAPPYWIITGNDFMMDKYYPLCSDIYEGLETKLI